MTVEDGTACGIGAATPSDDWDSIDWRPVEESVRKLRQRIFRATRERKWNKVRSLMKLMLRSNSNLLLSVKRVTQENQGKKTPGIDERVVLTGRARVKLVRELQGQEIWKSSPTRRIYIPKAGKPGQKRPLGIPTIRDRVTQARVKNALEPSWEALFDRNSYGYRPGRSLHDAIEQCWQYLKGDTKRPWILDADIKGAFDNINHQFLLNEIGPVPGRQLIKQWLKAGYVEAEVLHATESGTPQGGVISPLLLNIALNGFDDLFHKKKYGYVRYADDCAT